MRVLVIAVIHLMLAFGYSTPASASPPCSAPDGLDKIAGSKVVIFGEYHGTNEIPTFFYNVVCASKVRQNGTLVVGLELPTEFNAIFEPSNEPTAAAAIAKLRKHEFWNVMGDGRHSAAMLSLTEKLLALSYSDRRVTLVGLGNKHVNTEGAELLMSRLPSSESARALVLIGNAHARTQIIPVYNIKPFGATLRENGVDVLSLNIATSGGEAWLCETRDTCAPTPVPVTKDDLRPGIHLNGCRVNCKFHGNYFIKNLTVASPANAVD